MGVAPNSPCLNVAEVQAFSGATNIILHATAVSGGVGFEQGPANAVDGNLDTYYHSFCDRGPNSTVDWLQVYTNPAACITSVALFPRFPGGSGYALRLQSELLMLDAGGNVLQVVAIPAAHSPVVVKFSACPTGLSPNGGAAAATGNSAWLCFQNSGFGGADVYP